MKKVYWIVIGLVGIGIILGFFFFPTFKSNEKNAVQECINLCLEMKSKQNLTNGPCLSDNNPKWKIKDWVCDVAHWPRLPVDNLPENQCKDFREGRAHHFVEVDPECNFIRAY